MQECPYCKFDYTEIGLKDGKCPQCVALIQPVFESPTPAPTSGPSTIEERAQERFKAVQQIWRQSITSDSNISLTIKSQTSEMTVTDSVYSIQPREVKSSDQTTFGEQLDYELINVIGEGGIGVVYAARQASIDRRVAIKMLRDEYRDRLEHRDKFLAEAVLTGELDHPNIVPIYDLGRNDSGELFYAMKNVVGTPWDKVIQTYSLSENIEVLLKVADAIAFAHSKGIVHRDLKPENVMIGSFGEVLVMDWGIAIPTDGFRKSSSILRSQAMGGTPAYMAPELATGPASKIGKLSDVYLLGAILFEILSGTPPHAGTDVMDCVRNAALNVIVPSDVTGELMDVAKKAMSTIPGRRYHSVRDFQNAIRTYESHRDSLVLAENAVTELAQARRDDDYKKFSKALFGFQEALALWNENASARRGEADAKIAYAGAALNKGDFDLGLSLLDNNDDSHQPLISSLRKAIAERDARQARLQTVKLLVASLALFIFVGGSVAFAFIYRLYVESDQLNAEINESKSKIEKQLEDNEILVKQNVKARTYAETREKEAVTAQQRAELSRLETISEKQRAEERSYFAEIGLIGASIQQNSFTIASNLLKQLEESPAKSKLRHWEWGRYQYLAQGGLSNATGDPVVESHSESSPVITVNSAGKLGAMLIAMESGEIQYWVPESNQPLFRVQHGGPITDARLSQTGNRIISVGVDKDRNNTIKIWRAELSNPKEAAGVLERVIETGTLRLSYGSFSNDPEEKFIVAGGSPRLARIWEWRSGKEVVSLRNHLDTITCALFSPDNLLVATSSLDGSVRLWNPESGVEVQRFTGHKLGVYGLGFAPDGKFIASGGVDRRVLIWPVNPSNDEASELMSLQDRLDGAELPLPIFEELSGHTGTINDVAFSADGKRLISASNDNSVFVWETGSVFEKLLSKERAPISASPMVGPKRLQNGIRLRGHGGWVRSCGFAYDGQRVLSGSDDGTWRIWKTDDYKELTVLGDGKAAITNAAFSPTENLVATVHNDGSLKLWETSESKLIGSLTEGHEYLTNRIAWIQEQRKLVTAAGDNTIRVWDTSRGSQLGILENSGRNSKFALSADEQWLVSTGDSSGVPVWDLNSLVPRPRFRIHQATSPQSGSQNDGMARKKFVEPSSVAISLDGTRVVIGDRTGRIEFWDVSRAELTHELVAHSQAVVDLYILPSKNGNDTQDAISISSDGTIARWDLQTAKEIGPKRLQHFATVQNSAINANRTRIVTSATIGANKSKIWLWDIVNGELLQTRELQDELVQDVAFDESGSESVFVTTTNSINSNKEVWNWSKDGLLGRFDAPQIKSNSLWGVRVSSQNKKLVSFGGSGARLWDFDRTDEQMIFRPASSLSLVRFSADGELIATAGSEGVVSVWNRRTLQVLRKLIDGRRQPIIGLAFIENGLVSATMDGNVSIWDIERGEVKLTNDLGIAKLNAFALCETSGRLVLGGSDGSFKSVDTKELRELTSHVMSTGDITAIDCSTDSKWIAVGNSDKTISLWNQDKMTEIGRFYGHSATIASVQFSHDSLRLISASKDATVRVWDVERILLAGNSDLEADAATRTALGELVDLEYHIDETTSASFSKTGNEILSASLDGYAVIWPSLSIPPAVRFSRSLLVAEINKPVLVDANLVVSTPSTKDLDGCVITFRISPSESVKENLSILPDVDLEVRNSSILARKPTGEFVEIGEFSENEGELVLSFKSTATQPMVRKTASRIAYTLLSSKKDIVERELTLQIRSRDGRSANQSPEIMMVKILQPVIEDSESNPAAARD